MNKRRLITTATQQAPSTPVSGLGRSVLRRRLIRELE